MHSSKRSTQLHPNWTYGEYAIPSTNICTYKHFKFEIRIVQHQGSRRIDDYDNASQNWLANKFAKECKEVKDKYIFDALNSTWYEYNNNNILLELGKNYPLSLSEYIS